MNNIEDRYPPRSFFKDPEFVDHQDLIVILADPNKLYTKSEMTKLLTEHRNKEVK